MSGLDSYHSHELDGVVAGALREQPAVDAAERVGRIAGAALDGRERHDAELLVAECRPCWPN